MSGRTSTTRRHHPPRQPISTDTERRWRMRFTCGWYSSGIRLNSSTHSSRRITSPWGESSEGGGASSRRSLVGRVARGAGITTLGHHGRDLSLAEGRAHAARHYSQPSGLSRLSQGTSLCCFGPVLFDRRCGCAAARRAEAMLRTTLNLERSGASSRIEQARRPGDRAARRGPRVRLYWLRLSNLIEGELHLRSDGTRPRPPGWRTRP